MAAFSPSTVGTWNTCAARRTAATSCGWESRIPFPVNEPKLWAAYVPEGITQFLRLFSAWGGEKLERLREAGYEVVILDEGAEKELSGAEVREALRSGTDWEPLVPPGVARVLRDLDRAEMLTRSR